MFGIFDGLAFAFADGLRALVGGTSTGTIDGFLDELALVVSAVMVEDAEVSSRTAKKSMAPCWTRLTSPFLGVLYVYHAKTGYSKQ